MGESPIPPEIMVLIQEVVQEFRDKQDRIRLPLQVTPNEAIEILNLLKKLRS